MEVTFISLQISKTLNQSNMSNTAHKNFDITFDITQNSCYMQ